MTKPLWQKKDKGRGWKVGLNQQNKSQGLVMKPKSLISSFQIWDFILAQQCIKTGSEGRLKRVWLSMTRHSGATGWMSTFLKHSGHPSLALNYYHCEIFESVVTISIICAFLNQMAVCYSLTKKTKGTPGELKYVLCQGRRSKLSGRCCHRLIVTCQQGENITVTLCVDSVKHWEVETGIYICSCMEA